MTEISNMRGSRSVPFLSPGYILLTALLFAFGLYAAFIVGPAIRAAAQETVVRAIAEEDQQFCERFGMHVGTEAFAACSRELAAIRKSQTDRDSAAAQGIL